MNKCDGKSIVEIKDGKVVKRYPWLVKDSTTAVEKPRFVIPCNECVMYRSKKYFTCSQNGCKIDEIYKSLSTELSEQQKHRVIKIFMDTYHRI